MKSFWLVILISILVGTHIILLREIATYLREILSILDGILTIEYIPDDLDEGDK